MHIRSSQGLDPARDRLQRLAGVALPAGPARDLLRGTWLGHPLHPALTDLPIGFWTSAMVLDLLHRDPETAQLFIALGLVSAVPTLAAGLADWTALDEVEEERVGVVHAAANASAVVLYGASWLLRRAGRQRTGVAVSFVAGGAATIAGFFGGELAFPSAQPSEE
jgi:uncharacterized membrane protein